LKTPERAAKAMLFFTKGMSGWTIRCGRFSSSFFFISGYEQSLEEALNGAIFDEDHDESEFQFFFVAKRELNGSMALLLSPPFSGRREGHRNVQYVWAPSGSILRQGLHRIFAVQEDFGIKQIGSVRTNPALECPRRPNWVSSLQNCGNLLSALASTGAVSHWNFLMPLKIRFNELHSGWQSKLPLRLHRLCSHQV
jgi:hypothetical protein